MKKTIVALMCIVSLVIMTACGDGSPVDKALKKIDTAIEKLEKANKKGNKMSQEELDQIGTDLSEPLQVLNDALEKDEIGGITKLKIIGKVSKLSILAINAGLQNLDLGDLTKEAKKATPEKNE